MKKILNRLVTDKIILLTIIISFLLFLLMVGVIGISYQRLPELIPLFNQLPWGEARLGEKSYLFLYAGISFFVLLLNSIFAGIIYTKTPLISRILTFTTLLVSFFLFLYIAKTIQIIL